MQEPPFLIHRIFNQALNRGNLAVVDELVSVDAIVHLASWGLPARRMGLKQLIILLRAAFPDLHCTVEDEIFAGDKIAAHWTMRGTHRKSFLGNQPTGRSVKVEGMSFANTENGRIVEYWTLIDQMGILQQLGFIPPPS